MATKEVGVLLKVGKSGFENIDQLSKQLQATGVDTAELDKRAAELSAELQRLASQNSLIDAFAKQKAAVAASETAMQEARDAAQKLGKELAATEEPTKKQELAFTRARAAAKEADQAYLDQRLVLQQLREQLTAAGVASTDLAAAQVRTRNEIDAARSGVSTLETEYRALSTSSTNAAEKAKTLAANLQALQNGFKESAPAADALGQHLETAFRTLGVQSVKQVTNEIDRLKAALYTIKASDAFGPDIERASAAATARIKELEAELNGVPPAAQKARTGLEGVATSGTSAAASLEGATTRAVAMGAALLGIGSAGQVAQQVLGTAASFETLRTRLDQTLGSAKAGAEAFETIKKLAIDTPFEVTALTDTFIRLTNFGLQPTTTQMLALADTAAVAGGGTEALSRITLALGQAWAKTKLQGDEILQLTEAGVPVWDLLTKATGKNVVELQKMSEAGALGRDVIIKLFEAIGDKNVGASAKLMATYAGTVSNAKDAMAEFFDLIGRSGALEFLTKKLQEALDKFQELKDTGELEVRAKAISDAFIKFAEGVEVAFEAVKKLTTVIELLALAWGAEKVLAFTKALVGVQEAAKLTAVASAEMATAQRLAAVETVAAGVAVDGVGVKAAASAVSVGLLGRAMSLLSGLGVGALVLGVGELVSRFLDAKKAAEDGDAAVKKMLAGPPPGQSGAARAIRDVNAELADFAKNLPKLEGNIAGLTGEGLASVAKSTIENLRAIKAPAEEMQQALLLLGERAAKTLGIELPSQAAKASEGFKAVQAEALTLINQLPALGLSAKAASAVVSQALAKMIDGATTKKDFEAVNAEIKLMADAGRIGPGAVAELMKLVKDRTQELKDKVEATTPGIESLRDAANKAGIDADLLTTGVTKGGRDAAQAMSDLVAQVVASGVAAQRASPVLAEALTKRVQAAQTKEEVDLLRQQIDKAATAGKLFGADLTEALVAVRKKAEELSPAFRQAAEDAKLLGVELQGATQFTPEEGIRAFERLKASGKATADEVTQAFINLANQQIKAANGVVPAWVEVEAQLRGTVISIDDAGQTVVQTFADAQRAVKNTTTNVDDLATSLGGATRAAKELSTQLAVNSTIAPSKTSGTSPSSPSNSSGGGSNSSSGFYRTASGAQAVPPDSSGNWEAFVQYGIPPADGVRAFDARGNPIPNVYWRRTAAAKASDSAVAQGAPATAGQGNETQKANGTVEVKFNFGGGQVYSTVARSQTEADAILAQLQEQFRRAGGG